METSVFIFAFLPIAFVYGNIQVGTFEKRKMNDAPKLLTLDKMGPQMCAKRCLYHKSCKAFNYHSSHFVCELLGDQVSMSSDVPGVSFSNIATWGLSNDECYPNPCKEGEVCVKPKNGGYFCRRVVSFCSNNPCLNGGECSSELSSAVCRCPTGYSGPVCEFSNCDNYNCNTGTCIKGLVTPACSCTTGYSGNNCEFSNCDNYNCNDGTCIEGLETPACSCNLGYSGNNCEISNCDNYLCYGGTCIKGRDTPWCSCDTGFTGLHCEIKDCAGLQALGISTNDVYNIEIHGVQKQAYCDFETDGGGWTVFQRRIDGTVDFDKSWDEYKNGFGDAYGEYWIGNDVLHYLSDRIYSTVELRILVERWNGESYNASYSSFRVGEGSRNYGVVISGYSGSAVSCFPMYTALRFSTKDKDNDKLDGPCNPEYRSGGWWFDSCGTCSFNGLYYDSPTIDKKSCHWIHRSNKYARESLKTVVMMLRKNKIIMLQYIYCRSTFIRGHQFSWFWYISPFRGFLNSWF